MSYRYNASLPRDNPAHYMYAPFEGSALLANHAANREMWLARQPQQQQHVEPPVFAADPAAAEVSATATLLGHCLTAMDGKDNTAQRWGLFFLRKIETARGIRAAYDVSGRMVGDTDAGQDAYAYAALLFLEMMARSNDAAERLRWLNGALKTIDILVALGDGPLSPFGAHCARRAIGLELAAVRSLAESVQVPY